MFSFQLTKTFSPYKMAYMRSKCGICSNRQTSPATPVPVYHRHNSARQVRIIQGVEYKQDNLDYFCPSCKATHKCRMPQGLNICVSTSQLHDFHHPREEGIVCPPDTSHVDWLTIPGATISDLNLAWRLDYQREWRPMRVLLIAGLNDLLKGGDFNSVVQEIKTFWHNVTYQNHVHPGLSNQFTVATMLNPPKMVWLPDDGPIPHGHIDYSDVLSELNSWIDKFNAENNQRCVPRFHTWGTRTTTRMIGGVKQVVKAHRWNEWRQSEPRHDMLHMTDKMRVKMGRQVVRFFEGEHKRHGIINYG